MCKPDQRSSRTSARSFGSVIASTKRLNSSRSKYSVGCCRTRTLGMFVVGSSSIDFSRSKRKEQTQLCALLTSRRCHSIFTSGEPLTQELEVDIVNSVDLWAAHQVVNRSRSCRRCLIVLSLRFAAWQCATYCAPASESETVDCLLGRWSGLASHFSIISLAKSMTESSAILGDRRCLVFPRPTWDNCSDANSGPSAWDSRWVRAYF